MVLKKVEDLLTERAALRDVLATTHVFTPSRVTLWTFTSIYNKMPYTTTTDYAVVFMRTYVYEVS